FAQQPQQDMLGANVSVAQRRGFHTRDRENLHHTRCELDVARSLIRAEADLLLDFLADVFELHIATLEHGKRNALSQFDKAEEKVFGADEIVMEGLSLFVRELKHPF